MYKLFLTTGTIIACIGVITGAFGAHALKEKLSPDQLQTYETAVRYQMYHAFALIVVYLIGQKINSGFINYSGYFFIAGIVMFSGSVYLLSCRELLGIDNWKKILGPITPLGGLCFILGWICLACASIRSATE